MWIREPKNRGFTLLEIIISLGLIATALVAVLRLQAQNLDLQSEAHFVTVGKCLAQDRISRLESTATLREGTASGDFGEHFPYFSYREKVDRIGDTEDLFKIRIRILVEQGNHTKDLEIQTYLYRPRT